jgi:hypothetical protein
VPAQSQNGGIFYAERDIHRALSRVQRQGYLIDVLTSVSSIAHLAFNFGHQDAESAQAYGRKLFWEALNGGQSEAEIWKAAWQTYGNDRFLARCFAQEAKSGYDQAYHEFLKKAVKIKTEADIEKLPVGTFFTYPNGQLSRRTQ